MRQPTSWQRSNATASFAVLLSCFGLVLLLGRLRGVWLDEASGFWLTRHDIPLARIIEERWMTDVHPPLYSAYAWLLQPLFGGSVPSMRLINLGGVSLAGLTGWLAARRGVDRNFLALFAVLVAASPFFILYAAEFRSYFLQMLFGACLVVQLRMVHEGRGGLPLLGLTSMLLINLHYLGSVVGLILIAMQAASLAADGRKRDAAALLLIMLLAVLPLAAALGAMLAAISPVPVNEISPLRGLLAALAVLASALLPYVSALAMVPRVAAPKGGERRFLLILAGASAAVAVSYGVINLVTHNLLPRHMIAAAPLGAALLALLLEQHVAANPRRFQLICLNALLLAIGATTYGLAHKRWETNVARIKAARAACSDTRVTALNTMSLLGADDPLHSVPAIDNYFTTTYRLIARDAGFPVTILPDGGLTDLRGPCPTLLWIEHHYARPAIDDAELAHIAGFAAPGRIVRLQRSEGRALLAIYPAN